MGLTYSQVWIRGSSGDMVETAVTTVTAVAVLTAAAMQHQVQVVAVAAACCR
jgi:hypothetical protein